MFPGDQHLPQNDKSGQSNPFEAQTPFITRMSAQEIATLQAKLDRQLGPEYISDRPGAGGQKVQYLEAWKCINLANEIFGFNGWSSGIQNIAVDYMDENRETGRVSLGLSVVVRVTLRDGVFHEDIGYGSIENAKTKAAAFEKCKKEGTTDALKRALRNFGNVLGNCLYDKQYLKEVSKLKLPTPRFDTNELHRRPEFAPLPQPVATILPPEKPEITVDRNQAARTPSVMSRAGVKDDDAFDDDYFDDYDFEDRPILVESPRLNEFDTNTLPQITPPTFNLPSAQTLSRPTSLPSHHDAPKPQSNNSLQTPVHQHPPRQTPLNAPQIAPQNTVDKNVPPVQPPRNVQPAVQQTPQNTIQEQPTDQPLPQGTAGFIRLAKDGTVASPYNHKSGNFSPMARTNNGIDYGKSTPVIRAKVQKTPLANNPDVHNRMGQGQVPQGPVNPGHRKIGCPPTAPFSPHKGGLHVRANSGPALSGVKRNAQGQVIGADGRVLGMPDRIGNGTAQMDPKRVKN